MNICDILDNVFYITDELKKEFPELKNITAIEGWSYDTEHVGTFSYAKSFANDLRAGGHTDWRLPTLKEIKDLHNARGRMIDMSPFLPIKTDFSIVLKEFNLWSDDGKRYDNQKCGVIRTIGNEARAAILCVR